MRHLAVSLGVVATLIAGCGVGAADRPYDEALIREVGDGSDAANRLLPTLEGKVKVGPDFKDPENDRVFTALLQGQLSKLTQDDLDRAAEAVREGERRFDDVLPEFDRIASEISAARVDVGAHPRLSSNAKRFVDAWNGYLIVNAEGARSLGDAFTNMRPFFSGSRTLLRAADDAARLRSTAEFDKVRLRVRSDLLRRAARLRAAVRHFADGLADGGFVELVNGDPNAHAIVEKVNQRYPHGVLAELVTTG